MLKTKHENMIYEHNIIKMVMTVVILSHTSGTPQHTSALLELKKEIHKFNLCGARTWRPLLVVRA